MAGSHRDKMPQRMRLVWINCLDCFVWEAAWRGEREGGQGTAFCTCGTPPTSWPGHPAVRLRSTSYNAKGAITLAHRSISRRLFVSLACLSTGAAASSLLNACDPGRAVGERLVDMFSSWRLLISEMAERQAETEVWQEFVSNIRMQFKECLDNYPIADVVAEAERYASSSEPMEVFLYYLVSMPYTLNIGPPQLDGNKVGTRGQEIEESFSKSLVALFYKDARAAREYTHVAFWCGGLDERQFDFLVDCLAGHLHADEERYWWRARVFLLLLCATGRLEMLSDKTPLSGLRVVFLEWIEWMKSNGSQLKYDLKKCIWTVGETHQPYWIWERGLYISKCTPPDDPLSQSIGCRVLSGRTVWDIVASERLSR